MRQMMTTGDKRRALQGVPRFAGRDAAELDELAARAVEAIAAPGDVLTRESGPGATSPTYIVLTGEATIGRNGAIVDLVGPGGLVGDPDEVPATITAVTLMHLLVLAEPSKPSP